MKWCRVMCLRVNTRVLFLRFIGPAPRGSAPGHSPGLRVFSTTPSHWFYCTFRLRLPDFWLSCFNTDVNFGLVSSPFS